MRGQPSRRPERTHRNETHAAGPLIGMHIDRNVVVFHHRDQRVGQLRIVIIRVAVDKVQHLASAAASWAREPPPAARRMKVRGANRGNFRPCAMPNVFSSNHRPVRLLTTQFASGLTLLPHALS